MFHVVLIVDFVFSSGWNTEGHQQEAAATEGGSAH